MEFTDARRAVATALAEMYKDDRESPQVLGYGFDTGDAFAPLIDWDGIQGTYVYLVDKVSGELTPLSFPQFEDVSVERAGAWPKNTSRFLAHVQTSRLRNHPGHSSQKSHGRRGGAPAVTGQAALDAVPLGAASLGSQITDEQRSALIRYKIPDHFNTVNGSLRGHVPDYAEPAGPHTEQHIADLDSVMAASRTEQPIQVFRGIQGGAERMLGVERMTGDLTGLEFREDGFMSTSVRQSAAQEFTQSSGAVLMRVTVPAGTGAAKMTNRESGGEGEVVLERGLRLQVTADRGVDPDWGYRLLDVEVVPE